MHTKLKMASYANEQQPLIAENSFIDQGEFEKMLSGCGPSCCGEH